MSVCGGLRLDNVSLWRCVGARTSLYLRVHIRIHVEAFMHACAQSRQNFQPSCLQVCAAAASLCVPLIVISIARGLLMACTCVSHYRKLQILLSKSRMFHSHFVIPSEKEAARHAAESSKPPWQIFGTTGQEIAVMVQRHGCSFLKRERGAFLLCLELI